MTTTTDTLQLQRPRYPTDPATGDARGRSWWTSAMRWSVGMHAALIAAVILKSLIFPGTPIPYVPVLRVDIVGLPDQLKKDLTGGPKTASLNEIQKALEKAEAEIKQDQAKIKAQKELALKKVKEAAKDAAKAEADEMVLKPKQLEADREKKLKSSLARIKALAKISSQLEAQEKAQGKGSAASGALIKGNIISKGNSLSGDAKESGQSGYYDSLRAQLSEYWTLPVWLQRQRLSAQVLIYVDGRGRLRTFKFVKLSGNSQFDSLVKRTLNDAQPFPLPPQELAQSLLIDGILVGFPL